MGSEGIGKPLVRGHKRSFGGDGQRNVNAVVHRTLKARSDGERVLQQRMRWKRRKLQLRQGLEGFIRRLHGNPLFTDRFPEDASVATSIGLVANTLAVAHRWYLSGRPPFASIYEMLLSFVWAVAAMTLIAEKKFGVKIIGSITMPLAVVCVILMQLLPSEVRPLVPALQSTWLHVHVTLAMLSYAACALSCALAMMFLIKDGFSTESFLAWTSTLVSGIYLGMMLRFRSGGFAVVAWDPAQNSEVFL